MVPDRFSCDMVLLRLTRIVNSKIEVTFSFGSGSATFPKDC